MRSIKNFWNRISDGMALHQLWGQLRDETQASYRLYAGEAREAVTPAADLTRRQARRQRQGWVGRFLWAIVLKLSPVRRILLLAALVLIVGGWLAPLGLLLLLALLGMEVADRVAMKRDLEIARDIQLWLLPAVAPPVAGAAVAFVNQPANTVSGDFYDAIPRREGTALLLVVADVAGKGLPAAMVMATFQASLRTLAAQPLGVAEITTALNRYGCGHSAGGTRFTTAFLAEYEPATRRLRYCNAGHNPPLLRRAAGAVARLEEGSVPLGILPEAVYVCTETQLEPGEAVVMFSDGLTESFDPQGEEYGEARLREVLTRTGGWAAEAVLAAVLEASARFRAGARPSDDLTCLVLGLESAASVAPTGR